jgi:hypothetical protein
MSGKKTKAAWRSAREPAPPITPDRPTGFGCWTSWNGGLVVVGVIAVIAASFVLPGAVKKGKSFRGIARGVDGRRRRYWAAGRKSRAHLLGEGPERDDDQQ